MKDLLSRASSALESAKTTTSSTVAGAIQGTKDAVRGTTDTVTQAGRDVAFKVESTALGVRDSTLDKVNHATGAMMKVYCGVVGTVSFMVDVGLFVAAIVAPVPVIIGAGLLWLLEIQLRSAGQEIDSGINDEQASRKLDRITTLLKKYGQIPETATLKTDNVTMTINSKTGVVVGQVLVGEFRGRELDSLTSEDLDRLVEFVRDDDTKSILEAYQALRKARERAAHK